MSAIAYIWNRPDGDQVVIKPEELTVVTINEYVDGLKDDVKRLFQLTTPDDWIVCRTSDDAWKTDDYPFIAAALREAADNKTT